MGLLKKIIGSSKNDVKVAKYEYKKAKLEAKNRENENKTNNNKNALEACLNYTLKNYDDICLKVNSLFDEVSRLSNLRKLSDEEKEDFEEKLEYLYLIKDYFTFLNRFSNGMDLTNEQIFLIIKFNAYFDGVDVLAVENKGDESLADTFKEIGRGFKTMFGSAKQLSDFRLREYVENKYCDELDELKLPEIDTVIRAFGNTIKKNNVGRKQISEEKALDATNKTVECPKCHSLLSEEAKFCPKCGTKIEPAGPSFCVECGNQLRPGAKFCPKCGIKIK